MATHGGGGGDDDERRGRDHNRGHGDKGGDKDKKGGKEKKKSRLRSFLGRRTRNTEDPITEPETHGGGTSHRDTAGSHTGPVTQSTHRAPPPGPTKKPSLKDIFARNVSQIFSSSKGDSRDPAAIPPVPQLPVHASGSSSQPTASGSSSQPADRSSFAAGMRRLGEPFAESLDLPRDSGRASHESSQPRHSTSNRPRPSTSSQPPPSASSQPRPSTASDTDDSIRGMFAHPGTDEESVKKGRRQHPHK